MGDQTIWQNENVVVRTLNGGTPAKGTTVAKITDASTAHALNATFSDVEVEAALNALGTKINSIIDALEAFNISASA